MSATLLTGARIVTPQGVIEEGGLLIKGERIAGLIDSSEQCGEASRLELGGGWLLPGFIDTQVNGGGGVLFNDAPTVAGIRSIAAAHRRFGTTGLLPTLISDDLSVVEQAIDAVDQAKCENVPGVLGIHIEGPFLNAEKRGIHDPGRLQKLDEAAIAVLTRPGRGVRLVTLAPELAPPGTIARLRAAGLIVAAGHSMAGYDQTRAALNEGLSGFTHLFNAMTQLGSREPGMVGAALDDRTTMFGIIVDGQHVAPATLRVALAARGLDGPMLVTDAMPPVGTDQSSFMLMGRAIELVDGALRGPDGTLAGSALTMAQAVRNSIDQLGLSLSETSRLASGNPARFLGLNAKRGAIAPDMRADLVHLDESLRVVRSWIGGKVSELGE